MMTSQQKTAQPTGLLASFNIKLLTMHQSKPWFVIFTALIITLGIFMTNASIAKTSTKTIQPFTAEYNFSIENKYHGTAKRSLTQTKNNQWLYSFSASIPVVASAKQETSFEVNDHHYYPLHHMMQYKILMAKRTTTLDFKYDKKQLVTNYKGKQKVIAMPTPALDDLTLEMQIRDDLLNDNFQSNYLMASKNKIEATPFKKSALTKVTVPAGTFDVIVVERIHDDKNRKTIFWLAPKLDFLPVKALQNNDGKQFSLQLTQVNMP